MNSGAAFRGRGRRGPRHWLLSPRLSSGGRRIACGPRASSAALRLGGSGASVGIGCAGSNTLICGGCASLPPRPKNDLTPPPLRKPNGEAPVALAAVWSGRGGRRRAGRGRRCGGRGASAAAATFTTGGSGLPELSSVITVGPAASASGALGSRSSPAGEGGVLAAVLVDDLDRLDALGDQRRHRRVVARLLLGDRRLDLIVALQVGRAGGAGVDVVVGMRAEDVVLAAHQHFRLGLRHLEMIGAVLDLFPERDVGVEPVLGEVLGGHPERERLHLDRAFDRR